ncbi:MAG: GWxTD domain-containing protein, partial [Gemmatimonadales bacterium]
MRFLVFCLPLLLAVPAAGQSHAAADSLLSQQDTTGAIQALERLLQREFRDAEARWRVGQLYMSRHPTGASLSPNRRRAEEHLRYATRFAPDSAKYWLALAAVFRGEDWGPTRMQVEGIIERAGRAAEAAGDTALIADAEYRAGRVELERWEHYGNRWESMGQRLTEISAQGDWRLVEQFYNEQARAIPESGVTAAENGERHFRRALQVRPHHVQAAAGLVVLLGAQDRWSEALETARQLVRAAPDSGMSWAIAGLVYSRMNRWSEAQVSFTNAFRRFTPAERAPFDNLDGLLRRADRVRLAQMSPAQRAQTRELYWELSQPLMLTGLNETRTEYYARVTMARLRWSDPYLGHDGATTDRGAVYVRFGPPDVEAIFGRENLNWVYWATRLRFTFRLAPGFANAYLGPVSRELFEQVDRDLPGRFDNVPIMRDLDTITTQIAQFRGDSNRTDVAVFSWVPVDRMIGGTDLQTLGVESAAILRNDGGEVQRVRREETLDPRSAAAAQHRTWRLSLPAGAFYLRVEALAAVVNAAARHSEVLTVRSYRGTQFNLSDMLVTRRLAPRDSAPTR